MEISIIILGSIILPGIVVLLLILFKGKLSEEVQEKDQLIDTLEEIVEAKSKTIKDLLWKPQQRY